MAITGTKYVSLNGLEYAYDRTTIRKTPTSGRNMNKLTLNTKL